MLQLSPITVDNAQQWLALYDSVASFEAGTIRHFHERHLAQHGPEFMARVYQASMEQLLENAFDLQRRELCLAFRRAMSDAIDAHFNRLDLADYSLRCSLAANAKEWLAFMHCLAMAKKIPVHKAYAGFFSTYGDEFMAQAYHKAFEQVLSQRAPGESSALLPTLRQALDRALETAPCYAAA